MARYVISSTNAAPEVTLAKGHHREVPEHPDPIVWLLFLAFDHFLPRWQIARRI